MKKSKKQVQKELKIASMKLNEIELARSLDQSRTSLVAIMSQLEGAGRQHLDSAQRVATAKQSSSEMRAVMSDLERERAEILAEAQGLPALRNGVHSQVLTLENATVQLEHEVADLQANTKKSEQKLSELTERKQGVGTRLGACTEKLQAMSKDDARMCVNLRRLNTFVAAQIHSKDHVRSAALPCVFSVELTSRTTGTRSAGLLAAFDSGLRYEACTINPEAHKVNYRHVEDSKAMNGNAGDAAASPGDSVKTQRWQCSLRDITINVQHENEDSMTLEIEMPQVAVAAGSPASKDAKRESLVAVLHVQDGRRLLMYLAEQQNSDQNAVGGENVSAVSKHFSGLHVSVPHDASLASSVLSPLSVDSEAAERELAERDLGGGEEGRHNRSESLPVAATSIQHPQPVHAKTPQNRPGHQHHPSTPPAVGSG